MQYKIKKCAPEGVMGRYKKNKKYYGAGDMVEMTDKDLACLPEYFELEPDHRAKAEPKKEEKPSPKKAKSAKK